MEKWIESIKGTSVTLSYGNESECELTDNIKYNIVIISKKNIPEEKFTANLEQLKDLKNVQVYFFHHWESIPMLNYHTKL